MPKSHVNLLERKKERQRDKKGERDRDRDIERERGKAKMREPKGHVNLHVLWAHPDNTMVST